MNISEFLYIFGISKANILWSLMWDLEIKTVVDEIKFLQSD